MDITNAMDAMNTENMKYVLMFLLGGIVLIIILLCIFLPIHLKQKKKGGILDNPINFDSATGSFVYTTEFDKVDIVAKAKAKAENSVHLCLIDEDGGTLTFINEDERSECQYDFEVEDREDISVLRLKQKKLFNGGRYLTAAEMNGFWISRIDAHIVSFAEYAKSE